jgi:hypothetical protein
VIWNPSNNEAAVFTVRMLCVISLIASSILPMCAILLNLVWVKLEVVAYINLDEVGLMGANDANTQSRP